MPIAVINSVLAIEIMGTPDWAIPVGEGARYPETVAKNEVKYNKKLKKNLCDHATAVLPSAPAVFQYCGALKPLFSLTADNHCNI